MDKDKLFRSKISDRIQQASQGFYITHTDFLDLHEQAIARAIVREYPEVRAFFYGGYEDAERRILILVPEGYDKPTDSDFEEYLECVRVRILRNGRPLTHRDYLGAVLGLGIERRMIGDILVREDGADMLVMPEIRDFLLQEYSSVGRAEVAVSSIAVSGITVPSGRVQVLRDTVPSLRLDNIVSTAFRVSRTEAVKAIRTGIVSVNHMECTKADQRMEIGDVLSLRGKGKAILQEVGGESKKGRIWVEIRKYV